MEKQSTLTRVGLLVLTIVIIFIILLFLLFPRISRPPRHRLICGTNLKGLGTAMAVYANDYEGDFPSLPGKGPWSKRLGFDYDNTTPDFSENGTEGYVSRTITASWYLLIREADVPPKSFVCDRSDNTEFKHNKNSYVYLVELWDFGPDPYKHVSYAYHNPYGKYPSNGYRPAAFSVAADMSPWFKNGDIVKPGLPNQPPQLLTISDLMKKEQLENSNAYHHEYDGQNVLWADGHASYETSPNVGVKKDNIYTYWSTEENPSEQDIQGGTAPTGRSAENDAKSDEDSFLAI